MCTHADIDECRLDPQLCQPGICKNTYGSFYCECQQGYSVKQGTTICSGSAMASIGGEGRPPKESEKDFRYTVVKCLDLPSLEWCETYILNKCRPAVYYRQLFTSISWGGGWFQGGYERSPVGSTPKVLLKWRHRGRAVQVAEDYIRCSCNDCLVQPPVHRSTVGNWAFSVAGPQVWNCLPPTGGYIDTVSGDLPHSTQDVSVHESYPDIRLIWPSCVYTLYSGPRSISILK